MEKAPIEEVPKGAFLFHQGEPADGIYAVEAGRLRLIQQSPDGHEALVYVARVGDLILESALFSDVYHCDALATEYSRLRVFQKDRLLETLKSKAQTAQRFMEVLSDRIRLLRARMENRNIRSARDRVIHYIITLGVDGRVMKLEDSLKELALDLGIAHETLYRTLAHLEKDGIIRRTPDAITLLKPPH